MKTPFKFACVHCGQHIECETSLSGRQIKCPQIPRIQRLMMLCLTLATLAGCCWTDPIPMNSAADSSAPRAPYTRDPLPPMGKYQPNRQAPDH